MNKTFNINLGSYPFAIDEEAFNYIQHYLDTIRKHFSSSDGCDEILYDIEVRMAELFQEHLKGRAIISMKEVDEVIMIMGKPEDFGAEPMTEPAYSSNRGKKNDIKIKTGKRLFRDPDDKKLAGVCSGIAAYFGIEDPLWIRLIFATLFFTGTGVIFYIVLWALVPEAVSASDKLSMRGEPSTIQNIAKVVEDELSELGDKLNEWGKEIGSKKKSDDVNQGFQAKSVLAGGINVFGSILSGIVPVIKQVIKPLFIFIAIVAISLIGISWAASFVGLSFAAPVILMAGPHSGFLSYLGFGSIFTTIGIPLLGLMLLVSRMAFGYRIHKNVRTSIWTVWFLSLFTTMFATMSTIKDYSSGHEYNTMTDYNIENKDIKIVMPEENLDHSFGINLDKFFAEKGDKWAVRDVTVKIEKSKDALVHILKKISSRGSNSDEAQQNAMYVQNDLSVNGNEISISKYLTIPVNKKYRKQSIELILYIPEGKNISFYNNIKENLKESSMLSWDQIYDDTDNLSWTVTADGVHSAVWDDQHHHNKSITTGNWSKLIIENSFDVIIKKAAVSNVSFQGDKEDIEKIIHKNLDGTLTISAENDDNAEDITIVIETPSIDLIYFEGINSAKIEGFVQDGLKLVSKEGNDGSDETKIEFFGNVKQLDISLDGRQMLEMTGSGDKMDLQLNNGASVDGNKYMVKNVAFTGTGYDRSSLFVTETFASDNPKSSSIQLTGNPKKTKL